MRVLRSSTFPYVAVYGATMFLCVAGASAAFEWLQRSRLMPESFALELAAFAAVWIAGDRLMLSRLRKRALGSMPVARGRLLSWAMTCLLSILVVSQWLALGSFAFEFSAFALLCVVFGSALNAILG